MTYRTRRKYTATTFPVGNQICKIFLEPYLEYTPGFFIWNVGFAVGKSKRQLNDWYRNRKNKRGRSLRKKIVGRAGSKTIFRCVQELFTLRWHIEPGDGMLADCTSAAPDRQFSVFSKWFRNHPEWILDPERKEFLWYRPPFANDECRKYFNVRGLVPANPLMSTTGENYHSCFLLAPKGQRNFQSIHEIIHQLNQVQENSQL